jgi:hypothetical protein
MNCDGADFNQRIPNVVRQVKMLGRFRRSRLKETAISRPVRTG